MSILNVNTIQPIGSGTTVTVAATELKTSNFITVGTGASVTSPSANVLTLGTNSAERLRITSAGLIGIGTVSPSGPIHAHVASGTQRSYLEASAAHSFLRLKSGSTSYNSGLEFFSGASNIANVNGLGAGGLQFEVNGSERLRITSAGLVGVNCTPLAQFQVKAGTNQNIALSSMSSEASIEAFNDAGSANVSLRLRGSDFKFYTSSSERLRILSDGKVAIGGVTANSLLDVHGGDGISITHSGDTFLQSRTTGTTGTNYLEFKDSGGGAGAISYHHNGNSLRFKVNGSERLRISSDGNVGIGINNPQDYHANANSLVTSSGITLANTSQGSIYFADSHNGAGEYVGQINYIHSSNDMQFITNNTERMRLSGNGEHMVYSNGTVSALRTAASSSGSAEILYCTRNSSSVTVGTGVYAIYSNGSASSLSDRTQKKNIETTRDGYLEDLNRLRVVKYNWNDQEDGTPKELGLIAQEVEEVFPGLISDMRSDVGIGTTASTKGVKTSVLPYMLLKALQEANAEIVALKARVNTLEGS